MPNHFIDLTITSPPYDNLRKYNGYIFNFESIANELFRITKPGGVVVWIVGDTTINFCESLTSFKQAIYFHKIGFNLLDTMIYYKKNYSPAYPTLRRYANQFEYMFVFSNGKPKTFNPIQKETNLKTIERRKYGGYNYPTAAGKTENKTINCDRITKDASNVWQYGGFSKNLGHPAPFPEQLVSDHILSWSDPGDLILDPMCGSGTTCKMAKLNDRHYIGIDISSEYLEIARKRIQSLPTKLTTFI